jgi:hypothetical protein
VLAGGVVAAYLVNQVPLVAVAMALVALVGLLTAAHGGSWWLRAAVLARGFRWDLRRDVACGRGHITF